MRPEPNAVNFQLGISDQLYMVPKYNIRNALFPDSNGQLMTAKLLESEEMIYRCCHTYLLRLFRKLSEAPKAQCNIKRSSCWRLSFDLRKTFYVSIGNATKLAWNGGITVENGETGQTLAMSERQKHIRHFLDSPLDENQAANFLGLKVQTLRNWRCKRRGPNYLKIGSRVGYLLEDLQRYRSAHKIKLNS